MAQKEAADKNLENWYTAMAALSPAGWYNVWPQFMKMLTGEIEKQSPSESKGAYSKDVDSLVKAGYITKETAEVLKSYIPENFIVRAFMHFMIRLQTVLAEVSSDVNIFSLDRQYRKMQIAQPHPAPVDNLVRSMIIDPGRSTENRAELKKHGFNDTQIDNIILSYYRLYDEGTIRTAFLRGIISEEKMYERMRELGYTDTRTAEIVQTWELLPPPADLFTMVAHEAFEPDIYTKLGLDAEFPEEQVEWLNKQGIATDWARKYWISHWAQPSIGQGFEMLHRGVIDLPTLDLLFRAVEIPSFWRDKLTKIAYQPYTRVDVRRMHELGILTDEQLIQSFLDLGYDPEKAVNMANFTIRYNEETQAQLTRGAILESYREGLINRSDALTLLKEQDYTDALADYYLTLEDYNRDKEIQSIHLDNLKEQYLLGLVSETDTRNTLNKMGLLGTKIDALMEGWTLQLYKYQRLPTKGDLDTWLIKGIIDTGEYANIMAQHGFAFRHIQMYLQDLRGDIAQAGRAPTKAELDRWVKKKSITKEQYVAELSALGYADKYIQLFIKEV